jgi:hypothetical protein
MKVKELIRRLKLCNQELDMVFYHLKNHELKGCDYETLLEVDNRVELTIQDIEEEDDE